ncbi:MAG: M48 family metalloprotease, partial [Planctomycetota bacterium]
FRAATRPRASLLVMCLVALPACRSDSATDPAGTPDALTSQLAPTAGARPLAGVEQSPDSTASLPPIDYDKQLGKDAEAEILANPAEYPILPREEQAQLYAYLDGILARILGSGEVVYAEAFDWTLHVIDDRATPNAFAMPGGYLYVYTGLIEYLDSEAELAGVLAHEVAHADRRHSVQQMSAEAGPGPGPFQRRRGRRGPPVLGKLRSLKHSRLHEAEADEYSVRYVCATHYHTPSITGFFERMGDEGGRQRPEFLSTHPHDQNRVAAMNAQIATSGCQGTVQNVAEHQAIEARLPESPPAASPVPERPRRRLPPRRNP